MRPLALVRDRGRSVLLLEDPGGEPLDRLLGQPMEMGRFLRLVSGLSAALRQLHQRGLIHKDIKPENLLVDAAGNVYVADPSNHRIQVLDNNLNYKSSIANVGDPAAICISGGAHQYLYASDSNPVDNLDKGGAIYKMELNGTVVGKFGKAGKKAGEYGTVNEVDCRNPNQLYVGEVGNYRVQKVTLRSAPPA